MGSVLSFTLRVSIVILGPAVGSTSCSRLRTILGADAHLLRWFLYTSPCANNAAVCRSRNARSLGEYRRGCARTGRASSFRRTCMGVTRTGGSFPNSSRKLSTLTRITARSFARPSSDKPICSAISIFRSKYFTTSFRSVGCILGSAVRISCRSIPS
ncbi:hypothetical protein PF007_g32798, partial [Phytophthora fragariae]